MFIKKAAIMYSNGQVIEGRDYGHIVNLAHKLGLDAGDKIEGFVTSTEKFVTQHEAADIALESGQIKDPSPKLSPEDIWGDEVME